MADVGALVEGLAYATESWAGWRYVLSKSYRREIHQSWKDKSYARIFGEIVYGFFWMMFSIVFVVWCYRFIAGKGLSLIR